MCDRRWRRGYNAHLPALFPMRLRTRFLVVAALAALVALLPTAKHDGEATYVASLLVRQWLLDERAPPLAPWRQDGTVPGLAVDLRESPPTEDEALRAQRAAGFARAAAEWAAAQTHGGTPTTVDPRRGSLQLLVHATPRGVRAELPQPTGPALVFEAPLPGRISLLPAVVAIAAALLLRNVLLALLLAGVAGAIGFVATRLAATPDGPVGALWRGVEHFAGDALWRRSICGDFQLEVTGFVLFLFLTVAVVTANGGVLGVVAHLQRRVRGPVGAQLATFATGVLLFFDDYSSCLVTGTTMRPLCDLHRVSREKLAWIVDSTAAPIAGLSVVSTWVAYEISLYAAPLTLVQRPDGTPYGSGDPFGVFVASLPFRFYSLFTLALVVLAIVRRRDFGPMLAAERRARQRREPPAPLAPPPAGDAPGPDDPAARNAVVPLAVLVFGAIGLMLGFGLAAPRPAGLDGFLAHARFVLGNAHSMSALLLASAAACAVAVTMTWVRRLLPPRALLAAMLGAVRSLSAPFCVLFLAWALGHVCQDLGTGLFLAASVHGTAAATALPLVVFLVAGLVAFTTGTSFGTMAILLPNVIVLAHRLGTEAAFAGSAAEGGPALMLLCIAAVLEGSIFGDHCSPISDTTVLSSLGASCDHLAHVQTQLPYALLGFSTALVCGYLPIALLGPGWFGLSFGLGVAMLLLALHVWGADPDRPPAPPA